MKKRQIASFEHVEFEAVSVSGIVNSVAVSGTGNDFMRSLSGTEVIELRDWLNEITGHPTPRLITHEDVHTLLRPEFPGLVDSTTGPVGGTYPHSAGPVDLPGIRIGHDEGYNGGGQRTVIEDGKKVVEVIPALDQRGLSASMVLTQKEIDERLAILAEAAKKPHVSDAETVAHLPKIEDRIKASGMDFMDMSDREPDKWK